LGIFSPIFARSNTNPLSARFDDTQLGPMPIFRKRHLI
jgi:hypothetical protein